MNYSEIEDTSEKILSRRVQGEALQIMVSGLWPDFEVKVSSKNGKKSDLSICFKIGLGDLIFSIF